METEKYRRDFPIYDGPLEGKPVIYLDSACVSLRPRPVIDAMNDYYCNYPACGGRSVHKLSTRVSIACEEARGKIARFIHAPSDNSIVFTKNTTEGLNLVARGLDLKKGDVVLTTDMEHNSNLVPWHLLRDEIGIVHANVPSAIDNTFDIEAFKTAVSKQRGRLKIVSTYLTSNINGYTLPARELVEIAHDAGALVMLDAAQAVPRMKIDVNNLDVDFFTFSGHKMCGPAGIGILYGKEERLSELRPLITGGESVSATTLDKSELLPPPQRFEGGLQNYAGIIGLAAAVDYIMTIGPANIAAHETKLNTLLSLRLTDIGCVDIIGPSDPILRGGICSFNIGGVAPHDVAMILDDARNIMVRSGTLCAHSWFHAKKIKGCVRASFYLYNTSDDAEALASAIAGIARDLGR